MSNASSTVRLEIREGVAHLTLNRPRSGEHHEPAVRPRIRRRRAGAPRRPPACALFSSGAEGKNFCFGGDLRGMVAAGADVKAYLTELTTDLHAGMTHLSRMDAPVVAAVQGTAAGAGLGLVLAADLAIAGKSTKFAASYTAVGLTPDAGCTFTLPRAVGYKRAMELFLTNRVLDAERALEWGLVNQVVADDELAQTAAALAARLAAGPTGAFGGGEAAFRREPARVRSATRARELARSPLARRPPRAARASRRSSRNAPRNSSDAAERVRPGPGSTQFALLQRRILLDGITYSAVRLMPFRPVGGEMKAANKNQVRLAVEASRGGLSVAGAQSEAAHARRQARGRHPRRGPRLQRTRLPQHLHR